jgi:hypothetical protein
LQSDLSRLWLENTFIWTGLKAWRSATHDFAGYEAFFIPDSAKSAADVHDIVGPFDWSGGGELIPNLTLEEAQEIVARYHSK